MASWFGNLNIKLISNQYLCCRKEFFIWAISFENYAAPSTLIFRDFRILKLNDLSLLKLLSFACQCFNKISPDSFHTFLDSLSDVHQYSIR